MKTNKTIILAGTALAGTAVATLFAGNAMAQSTGSQAVEVIIKGGPRSTGGLAVTTNQAKDQSIVNKDYIQREVGTANFAQDINLLPGVNYTSEDPTGLLSGDFRMHGFDGAHVSITVDGTPLNDTGNYAIYPGEYVVAEAVDHVTVNMGQTEVDSPTASAIGGTVNIVTKIPDATPSVDINPEIGSYEFKRLYVGLNTGAVGPTGLRSYFSFNSAGADKWRGSGDLTRWGVDGREYQPLDNGGFLSVAYTWVEERSDFYYDGSVSQEAQYGYNFDYNSQWAVPTAVDGKADGIATPTGQGGEAGNDANYYALHPNPVDFGDIRGQSRFNFGDKATLTVDPYFFFTIANGGGTTSLSECDPRLVGSTFGTNGTCGTGKGNGVDLNHDGDVLDTVLVYSPSNTETHRYGVNTSFIYRFTDTQTVQATYTLDYGRHRQTGDMTYIDQQDGEPDNVFGSKPGYGQPILAADGSQLESRNRFSIAKLNQFSLNYVGRFLNDKLHINVGVRDPHFERDINQYCYTYNGSSAYCDSVGTAAVAAALAKDDALAANLRTSGSYATNLNALLFGGSKTIKFGPNGTPNFAMPYAETFKFTKMLPNVGASYDFDEHNQVYATASEGYSAPKTDDLYVSSVELVKPETSENIGAGYRYKNSIFTFSTNPWASTWQNHIVQSYDPTDPTLSIDRNVGEVKLYGLDNEASWKVTQNFSVYGSAAFTHSALQNNYDVSIGGVSVPLPVKGKELVLTPDQTYALRGQYKLGKLSIGVEAKYQSKRYVSDMNDAFLKANTVANLDIQYQLPNIGRGAVLQLNVDNLFDSKYDTRSTTVSNVNSVVTSAGTYTGSTYYLYTASPAQAFLELKAKF